uniref:Uncharacterized protein n=1 Tax=Heterorhabditis bacteriophora TaxID=37862 RepID=A0A1I7WGU8_HETBA
MWRNNNLFTKGSFYICFRMLL